MTSPVYSAESILAEALRLAHEINAPAETQERLRVAFELTRNAPPKEIYAKLTQILHEKSDAVSPGLLPTI